MSRLKFTPKVKQKLKVSQALLYSASAFAFAGVACVAVFLYSNFGTSQEAFASGTCPGVPYFEVNLTGHSDSVYVSPPIIRSGLCCGANNPDRCIEFGITLDANSEGVKLEIASGAIPPGALYYYVNCLAPTPIGQPICLSGNATYKITFCKPGNNQNTYRLTSNSKAVFPHDTSVRVGGPAISLRTKGMTSSTVTWRSIYPGTSGQYNSYLSSTIGANVNFLATSGAPSYIDYEISGTHVTTCGSNPSPKDTVRITVYPALTVQLTPNPALLPLGGTITLNAIAGGGTGTYTYQWYSGSTLLSETSSSLLVSVVGNYSVVVCDALCATMGSVTATTSVSQSGCTLPINLGISAITSSTAKVSWDPIDGVYGYKIRKRPIGQTWWTNTGSYAPTPFRKFVQLIENTTYEFQIQTICNSTFTDTSIWSQVYTVTTQPYCSNPDTVNMLSVNDTTATVKWTAATNATKYRIRYRRIGDAAWINKYQVSSLPLQYKIKGLLRNTNYEVQVLTDCGYESGYSAFSQSVNFTTTGAGSRVENETGISGSEILSVFPNPNNGAFGISIKVSTDAVYHLEIVNAAGSKVFEDEIIPTSGNITRNITLEPNITRGIYFVRISGGEETYSSQFMLNR